MGGPRSTEKWKAIKGMKTNNRCNDSKLLGIDKWEGHHIKLLRERKQEFANDTTKVISLLQLLKHKQYVFITMKNC